MTGRARRSPVRGGRAIRPGAGSSRRCSPIARSRSRAGGTLSSVTVAYETWGTLNADASNAVLLLHALTLDSHAAGPVEPGPSAARVVEPVDRPGTRDRHRSVLRRVPERARRLPGHDRARRRSIPTTGTPYGSRFPVTTIRDQVDVEAALADHLGIARWYSVIGGSMGGQRALEWAVKYRDRVPRAVIIACGAAATAEQIALCSLQIRAIEADPHFHGGDYYDAAEGPWRGMSIARGIGQVSYRSELELAQRFNRGHQNDEHPFEGGQLHGRVVPRVPRREARAPLRREHLHRVVTRDESSRRRPRRGAVSPRRSRA